MRLPNTSDATPGGTNGQEVGLRLSSENEALNKQEAVSVAQLHWGSVWHEWQSVSVAHGEIHVADVVEVTLSGHDDAEEFSAIASMQALVLADPPAHQVHDGVDVHVSLSSANEQKDNVGGNATDKMSARKTPL